MLQFRSYLQTLVLLRKLVFLSYYAVSKSCSFCCKTTTCRPFKKKRKNLSHRNARLNTFTLKIRALEKVDKEQLNRKRFEIYQAISWLGEFLLTLSLNNITKLASKSIKLGTFFQIIIKSICIKFLSTWSTLLKNIHTSPRFLTPKSALIREKVKKSVFDFFPPFRPLHCTVQCL